jgi:DNA-binding transcriptional ArsR family regulator
MKDGPNIAAIAALLSDPARANMLSALMRGQALTATELAHEAGVMLSTASGHVSKLADGGLVAIEKQGRHHYFACPALTSPSFPSATVPKRARFVGAFPRAARKGWVRLE